MTTTPTRNAPPQPPAASTTQAATNGGADKPSFHRVRGRNKTSLYAHGEPMVWLTGGALAVSLVMIVSLLVLVVVQGVVTFWPMAVVRIETASGVRVGEATRGESYRPEITVFDRLPEELRETARQRVVRNGGEASRRLIRTGNYELTNEHFNWVSDFEILRDPSGAALETLPPWAIVTERMSWGRFYGEPAGIVIEGKEITADPAEVWRLFEQHHATVRHRWEQRRSLEVHDIGRINHASEHARLQLKSAELKHGKA